MRRSYKKNKKEKKKKGIQPKGSKEADKYRENGGLGYAILYPVRQTIDEGNVCVCGEKRQWRLFPQLVMEICSKSLFPFLFPYFPYFPFFPFFFIHLKQD